MEGEGKKAGLSACLSDQGFVLSQVLAELKETNTIVYLGKKEEKPALVVLQRRAWVAGPRLEQELLSTNLQIDVQNAEYCNYTATLGESELRVTWPADQFAIDKWRQAELRVIRETPLSYAAGTLPYVQALPLRQTEWVDNILAGKKEADRVWLAHPDFVLVPDFKMDVSDSSTAYLQALFREPSLRSLRDLRAEHLPLLRRVRCAVLDACAVRNFREHDIRMFFHYYPTFWRMHLHVAHVRCIVPGKKMLI